MICVAVRQARGLGAEYHQRELRSLLEHVREGFALLDAGEIDEFELDELVHHYERSANELWKVCSSGSGRQQAAIELTYARERDEEPEWWERGAFRRSR